ncbi:MAG: hypothetical protein PWQ67_1261 [Clostridia bacterium]|jgi:rhodanese-related sulfurtransferase|nr:hypothetical protein [Clostridia bacterium]MDN5322807.1 hypothetical protein [Clostridia bacterium]
MIKTNGEKALLAVCLITIIFVGMALVSGIGKEVKASQSPIEPAVFWYFERMPDDSYRISGEELKTLMDTNKNLFILDIRNAEDYEKDHIEGAINIPFKKIGDNLDKIPKDRLVIVYCYSGQNGGQVVALLNISGFYAKSLSGGWGGWLQASGQHIVSPSNSNTTAPADNGGGAAVQCPTS